MLQKLFCDATTYNNVCISYRVLHEKVSHQGSSNTDWFLRATAYMLIVRICLANSVCPSVRLSVRPSHVCIVSTAECIIKVISPSDNVIILIFPHQGSLRKSDGFTPKGGAKYKGGSNFRPICGYISETVIDRGIVTMEDEYKVVCALSKSATFDDFEWPWTSVSRSRNSLKANISQMVHPLHSMFDSRLGFSGSAYQMALFAVR